MKKVNLLRLFRLTKEGDNSHRRPDTIEVAMHMGEGVSWSEEESDPPPSYGFSAALALGLDDRGAEATEI